MGLYFEINAIDSTKAFNEPTEPIDSNLKDFADRVIDCEPN